MDRETCVSHSFIYSPKLPREKRRKEEVKEKKSKDKKERRHEHDLETRCPT